MGGLGFLNEVEIGDVEKSIYSIIRGDYKIEKTMKLLRAGMNSGNLPSQ